MTRITVASGWRSQATILSVAIGLSGYSGIAHAQNIPLVATVTDTDGVSTTVTDLRFRYHAPNMLTRRPDRRDQVIHITLTTKEGRITSREGIDVPFAQIERVDLDYHSDTHPNPGAGRKVNTSSDLTKCEVSYSNSRLTIDAMSRRWCSNSRWSPAVGHGL